ncbi:MAG: hypothetical protein C4K60_04600 [Ideonella sp. MAG2]|nr:MAG: hypothetical protein C4K60_04600 [Ideonella sp. MAG2]
MRVVQSPESIHPLQPGCRVFMAGSIDMGKSEDWQSELIEALALTEGVLFNPRRKTWNPDWPAEASFPTFAEQVEWELAAMEAADLIVFYFAPTSQAPITLLELGLAARTGKAVVCCPVGFWRKGNVDVVCKQYRIPMVGSVHQLAGSIMSFASTGKAPEYSAV